MSRRRITKLSIPLESFELCEQVQAQAARVSFASEQRRAAAQNEREPRYPLDAFIGRGDQKIDGALLKIDRQRTEAAHRIYNESLAMLSRDRAQLLDGIENAGGRLTMNHRDMRNG